MKIIGVVLLSGIQFYIICLAAFGANKKTEPNDSFVWGLLTGVFIAISVAIKVIP